MIEPRPFSYEITKTRVDYKINDVAIVAYSNRSFSDEMVKYFSECLEISDS